MIDTKEKKVEEKVFENPHIRENGGCAARKARGEAIKKDMEDERVFRTLKREQGKRSGQGEPEFDIFDHICF